MCMCRNAQGRIETHLKALTKFSEILLNAPSGILTHWIGNADLNHRCDQKPLDLCHGCHELHALALAQRFQKRLGKGIGSMIQLSSLMKASLGEVDHAHSPIVATRLNFDQALPLE